MDFCWLIKEISLQTFHSEAYFTSIYLLFFKKVRAMPLVIALIKLNPIPGSKVLGASKGGLFVNFQAPWVEEFPLLAEVSLPWVEEFPLSVEVSLPWAEEFPLLVEVSLPWVEVLSYPLW